MTLQEKLGILLRGYVLTREDADEMIQAINKRVYDGVSYSYQDKDELAESEQVEPKQVELSEDVVEKIMDDISLYIENIGDSGYYVKEILLKHLATPTE